MSYIAYKIEQQRRELQAEWERRRLESEQRERLLASRVNTLVSEREQIEMERLRLEELSVEMFSEHVFTNLRNKAIGYFRRSRSETFDLYTAYCLANRLRRMNKIPFFKQFEQLGFEVKRGNNGYYFVKEWPVPDLRKKSYTPKI